MSGCRKTKTDGSRRLGCESLEARHMLSADLGNGPSLELPSHSDDLGAMIENSPELQAFIKSPLLTVEQHKSGCAALAKKAKLSLELDQACLALGSEVGSSLSGKLMVNILPRNLYFIEQLYSTYSGHRCGWC